MQRFHFISGLPRAGSTLLSAILSQNPRFHAGVSSPLTAFFSSLLGQVSVGSEWSTRVNTSQRRRLLHGLFEAYYADLPAEKQVVFDTNRVCVAPARIARSVSTGAGDRLRAQCRLGHGQHRTPLPQEPV
jgi:hypothetical protein